MSFSKFSKLICVCFLFFLFFALFLLSGKDAFAVTVSIVNAPSGVSNNEFSVNVSISGARPGNNFLRIELYKDGTTNYFGETNGVNGWYSGSDGTQYSSIVIQSNNNSNTSVKGRIGNPSPKDFSGNGNYKLRIKRYTASGNEGSSDIMDSVDVNINISNPTPTITAGTISIFPTPIPLSSAPTPTIAQPDQSLPIPTPTQILATPTSDSTASITSSNLSDTLVPTDTPSPSQTNSPLSQPTVNQHLIQILTLVQTENGVSTYGAILGTNSAKAQTKDPKSTLIASDRSNKVTKINYAEFFFIAIGFGFLAACGILVALKTGKLRILWRKYF